MAYTALYRKFRPTTFEEMVGQEHITRTLKNQIIAKRVGHAYLFNGGRGTGKTSAAKVLARAINCFHSKDGEPCNECEICKEALNGSLTDIVEMDAASNNSVEDIRQIRDEVNFLPTKANYRVYIIDEVHMLSTGAFNALLKTLEEPPEHVKFILATTEPQKLPATILSRCQRFDFKKLSEQDIAKRLEFVCQESKIKITDAALKLISVLAEGAMRDALSILERCIQDGVANIDEEKVKDLVGIPKFIYIHNITTAILNQMPEEALQAIEEVLKEGKDLQNIVWEMIKYLRDIFVYKTSQNVSIYSQEEVKQMDTLAKNIEKERLLFIIYELSNLEKEIKWSSQKVILFQVSILKLCQGQLSHNIANAENQEIIELKHRMAGLESQIRQLKSNEIHKIEQNVEKSSMQAINSSVSMRQKAEIKSEKITPNVILGNPIQVWPKVVSDLKQEGKIMLYTNLMNSNATEINDMTVGISFPKGLTPFGKTILEKNENITEIERRLSMEFGKPMRVKYIEKKLEGQKVEKQGNPIEALAQDMDLPFHVFEE